MKLALCQQIIGKDPQAVSYFNKLFRSLDLHRNDLAAAIECGWAFCAQHRPPRRSANFVCSGFLAVDVDSGLRIEDVLRDDYFRAHGAALYPTASHTEQQHRFRLVFELVEPITTATDMTAALTGLAYRFKGDMAATDACRVFFGNPECQVDVFDGLLPADEVSSLIAFAKERASASKLQGRTGSARVRSRISIPADAKVRTQDGQEHLLWTLNPGTRVF